MSGTAQDTPAGVSMGTGTSDSGSSGNSQSQQAADGQATETGSQGQQSQQPSGAWYDSVSDTGLKELATKKGWKGPEDALKSYKELETLHSSKQAASTAPASPKDYNLEAPTDLPEGMAYNDQFADWYRGAVHKMGGSQELAAGLHKEYVEFAKAGAKAQAEAAAKAQNDAITKAAGELTSEWGQPGTPTFTRNVEMAKRAIRMADPKTMDALKEVGAVIEVNGELMVKNASLFKVFSKMGQGMYAEDNLYGQPASDKNPFDDKTEDEAMQGRFIKNDPDKAAALIKAAGKEKFYHHFMERHKAGLARK